MDSLSHFQQVKGMDMSVCRSLCLSVSLSVRNMK